MTRANEIVVEIEAAAPKLAERTGLVALDVRREHAGRCLRRAAADAAEIEDADPRAGRRQLVRAGAADDTGANDCDLGVKTTALDKAYLPSASRRTRTRVDVPDR